MKRYRVKNFCPHIPLGVEVPSYLEVRPNNDYCGYSFSIPILDFLTLIEEVSEPDPVEEVARWITDRIGLVSRTQHSASWQIDVASSLLAAGLDWKRLK